MKTVLYIVAGFLTSALVVACGGSNDPGNVAAPGAGIHAGCPVGYTFVNGMCTDAYGRQVGTGSTGFYAESYRQRNLNITGAYAEFLRDAMGVCDRERVSGGGASCQHWISSGVFDVVIQSPISAGPITFLQATFRANRSSTGVNSDYSYSLPSPGAIAGAFLGLPVPSSPAAYLETMRIEMTVTPTNNSQGFEARGYGNFMSKANRSLIQIQIPQGSLQDNSLPYRIAYRNQIIANGQFLKCSSADCGLSRPVGY